jgi:glycosyltransferase involved in cell wall biosynthesis
VVATVAGSLPEVLGDAAEWCEVGDVDGLAAALDRVLGDDARRAELARLGPTQAAGYTWSGCAGAMAALYSEVAADRPLGAR